MGRKDKEEKGSFGQRFLKELGIFALAVSLMFAGSSFLTACSPSTPPATPPGIITPAPGEDDDDKKPEEPGTETPEPEDPQPENPGEGGTETEDPNKGEEGKGEEGEGEETNPGEGEEEEEVDVSTLLYYTDDQNITHYNVKGMINSTFARYNDDSGKMAKTLTGVTEINNDNTTVLTSRFKADGANSQLDMLLIVKDNETNADKVINRLVNISQKIDLTAFSEEEGKNKLTDLDEYFSSRTSKKLLPSMQSPYGWLLEFDSTFLPGEDDVADSIVDIIKEDSIVNNDVENRVSNPDFDYVLGFITNAVTDVSGPGVGADGHSIEQTIGARMRIKTYYLINKDGNLCLSEYTTYAGYESNMTGDTWQNNLKNHKYYMNYLREEKELITDYEMEYQRESTPSAGEPTL